MHVIFWHSDKPRERFLAEAVRDGAKASGDTVELRALTGEQEPTPLPCDVAAMVGVKSRPLYRAHWAAGIHTLMFDKGYVRHASSSPVKCWEYWRVAADGHHPTRYLQGVARPFDRIERLECPLVGWRKQGGHVVLAGSSAKYHDFYGLKAPTAWAEKTIQAIRDVTQREIVYRPKPSWKEATAIAGARFSHRQGLIDDDLKGAHVLVTHGSNACFESVLLGVPCVILGDGVAAPISSTTLAELESPRLATPAERWQWAANLAYCQWTLAEYASGEAWGVIREQLRGVP